MNDLEINCFVKAAELKSISAAAEQLYVSKATVSRNISMLETELEVTLLARSNAGISLTTAGEIVYRWFKEQSADFRRMLEEARRSELSKGKLSIGIMTGQMMSPLFQKAVSLLSVKNENADIHLYNRFADDLIRALFAEELDMIALLSYDNNLDSSRLSSYPVCALETLLVVPGGHPLATKHERPLADFKDEIFIMFPNDTLGNICDSVRKIFDMCDLRPKIRQASNAESYSLLIESGQGIGIGNENNLICNTPTLTEIRVPELKDLPTYSVLVWLKSNPNPMIGYFLELLEEAKSFTF